MKNLCAVFLLLAPACFAQVYSNLAFQNSPGNYARALPYAQVTLCASSDLATPCTNKVATFTSDTLLTQCTQSAAGGFLPGQPTSGTNCNNPGVADANGNFTLIAPVGNYRMCVNGLTLLCQEISIGGGGGTGNVNCPTALDGSLGAFTNPSNLSCDRATGTDFVGDIFAQSFQALGPVNGFDGLTGGLSDPLTCPQKAPTPCIGLANTFYWLAPSTVATPFAMRPPNTVGTVGQVPVLSTQSTINGTIVDVLSWLTPSSGGVTFQTNSVNNSDQSLLNLVPGSGITIVNTSGGIDTISATGSGGTVTSLTATSPIVATPTPITGTGAFSCPSCLTSIPSQYTYHTCTVVVGADNGTALVNSDLGPQTNQCKINAAGTLAEITLSVDNSSSTTSVQVRKRHCATFTTGSCTAFTLTNLLSAVLAAAATGGADACAKSSTSATCLDGTTSSGSVTVSTTALAQGDWLELTSGTADTVTKRVSVSFTWTN